MKPALYTASFATRLLLVLLLSTSVLAFSPSPEELCCSMTVLDDLPKECNEFDLSEEHCDEVIGNKNEFLKSLANTGLETCYDSNGVNYNCGDPDLCYDLTGLVADCNTDQYWTDRCNGVLAEIDVRDCEKTIAQREEEHDGYSNQSSAEQVLVYVLSAVIVVGLFFVVRWLRRK